MYIFFKQSLRFLCHRFSSECADFSLFPDSVQKTIKIIGIPETLLSSALNTHSSSFFDQNSVLTLIHNLETYKVKIYVINNILNSLLLHFSACMTVYIKKRMHTTSHNVPFASLQFHPQETVNDKVSGTGRFMNLIIIVLKLASPYILRLLRLLEFKELKIILNLKSVTHRLISFNSWEEIQGALKENEAPAKTRCNLNILIPIC